MKKTKILPVIVALFVGWVSGLGSWYFIDPDQSSAGEQGQTDVLPAALHPAADEDRAGSLAVISPSIPSPLALGDVPDISARLALLPVVDDALPEMSVPLMDAGGEGGVSSQDGVVQDTGEFIDADDPQAYVAILNARSDDDTVQDTGEFLDVDDLSVPAGSDAVPQDTGEFIDVDDPQAYAAYWDRQADGVVHDTGEFIAVDAWQGR